jgi:CDP-glucose 4,6-dehydratase
MLKKKNVKDIKKFWSNKKVLITGHTGFKGSWLCNILLNFNSKIIGYSLKPKKNSFFLKTNLNKRIKTNIYENILNKKKLNEVIKKYKPEIIFHFAAQSIVNIAYTSPEKTFEVNCVGTLNILDQIKKNSFVKSAVIVTTDKVYKNNDQKILYKEENDLWGKDPYSASKVCAEQIVSSYLLSFKESGGLKFTSVARSGNVVGGGDHNVSRIVPDIFNSHKKKIRLFVRMPNAIRPWLHVLETSFAYITLSQYQYKNNRFDQLSYKWNFGPNKCSFKKVIYIVKFFSNKLNINYKIIKSRFKEAKILMLSNYKAYKYLGWKPRWSIVKTLENIIEIENLRKKKDIIKKVNQQILNYLQ